MCVCLCLVDPLESNLEASGQNETETNSELCGDVCGVDAWRKAQDGKSASKPVSWLVFAALP